MIDFACKSFKLEEVIRCGLGITKSEFIILNFFINNKSKYFSTTEVSKSTKLDITTVQKAVKKLHQLNIISRSQVNIKEGGYQFLYQIKPRGEIKAIVMNIIKNWSNKVEQELDKWT